jgi:hypothetical protein
VLGLVYPNLRHHEREGGGEVESEPHERRVGFVERGWMHLAMFVGYGWTRDFEVRELEVMALIVPAVRETMQHRNARRDEVRGQRQVGGE